MTQTGTLSPYSSCCACGHSPWVFALPGLILLLPVISFCLLLIDASCAAALLSFVLGQRLLLTLSFSLQCRLLAFLSLHFQICSPLFIFLLSPACTQIYPLTPPPLLEIAPHTPVCVLLSKSLGSSSTIVWGASAMKILTDSPSIWDSITAALACPCR